NETVVLHLHTSFLQFLPQQQRKFQSLHGVMFPRMKGLNLVVVLLRRPDYQLSCFYKSSYFLAEYHIS
ncbi:hypothetical protein, partial [Vibrio owensii]|uniref:hypothetical protein n=1 Tax=Vibrio owensii TaxID=696485 RepID=UPI002F4096E4